MQVVLEVTSDAHFGERVWLKAGQTVVVGRTLEADFVLPSDCRMSSVHFALQCGNTSCRIRDLQSSNGTFLNGQKVTEGILRDQDEIVAGETTFAVLVEGAQSVAADKREPEEAMQSGTPGSDPVSTFWETLKQQKK